MAEYYRPTQFQDALRRLARSPCTILAGGTDHYASRVGKPLVEPILDVTAIRGLGAIAEFGDHWRIGAAATWTGVIEAPLPSAFDGLKLAAREIGGAQIQNSGTLAGNLCNASPAADGVPALLALDASVELASVGNTRVLPLAQFILGPRKTARRPDELVAALLIPKSAQDACSHFTKLGARKYLVISIAMVAGTLAVEDGKVAAARIAVGACSPVALRLGGLENDLLGRAADSGLGLAATPEHREALSPIDDVRASADYRRHAALVLVRRVLARLGAEAP